jgi:hypothetical protein
MAENGFEDIAQLKEELFLLSRLANPNLDFPKAGVKDFDKYQPDDDVPVYSYGGVKGTVKIPEELCKLHNHGFRVQIRVPLLSETDDALEELNTTSPFTQLVLDYGIMNKRQRERVQKSGAGTNGSIEKPEGSSNSEIIKPSAFEVRMSGEIDIPGVCFTWGKITGIASLSFEGVKKTYQVSIPEGFTLDSLLELLTKGSIRQFVIEHAMLSQKGRDEVEKYGI